MNYVGISNGFHDAGLSVVNSTGDITFAGHSERYSKFKSDKDLTPRLIVDALQYVDGDVELHYYERPYLTAVRQYIAGQTVSLKSAKARVGKDIMSYFPGKGITTHGHHLSHAAAGFQTSPFDEATVVIIDAIGELDTISIWNAHYDKKGRAKYKKVWSNQYPNSIGLFYSAATQYIGLKPLDEEYILMGMAAYGSPACMGQMLNRFIKNVHTIEFKENLHIGFPDDCIERARYSDYDIASSAQGVVEYLIKAVLSQARLLGTSNNLVYGGGVALNCVANRELGEYFKNVWIMPNPGDCGSSLGAAALGYGKKINWKNAYLGYDIKGPYPVNSLLDELLTKRIVGVASGRAEFGPRALGNRSLLADPRGPDIKDMVNEIKHRQKFRPFAPVILEEMAHQYFYFPHNHTTSRYMQVVARCINPDQFPAITHVDQSSRVQTVPKDGSGIRELLEKWYILTECPMLLNTSLNIRGEPMVNDRFDADRFQSRYGIKVLS